MPHDETNRVAPVTGPTQPKQATDIYTRWGWVEHSVWTERMLTRLEHSEPTTVWYGLWDKVLAERNLKTAFWAVWRNAGAPGVDSRLRLRCPHGRGTPARGDETRLLQDRTRGLETPAEGTVR